MIGRIQDEIVPRGVVKDDIAFDDLHPFVHEYVIKRAPPRSERVSGSQIEDKTSDSSDDLPQRWGAKTFQRRWASILRLAPMVGSIR